MSKLVLLTYLIILTLISASQVDTAQETKQTEEEIQAIIEAFDGIVYDKDLSYAYPDDLIWVEPENDTYGGDPNEVQIIDGPFFDTFIKSRWTSEDIPDEDTIWVIGMTTNIPFERDYIYHLIGKTIRILNDHFFQDVPNVRFGLVDFYKQEDIKEAFGGTGPCLYVLNNGIAYRNYPMRESYH